MKKVYLLPKDEGNNVDSEIESYLYETLKPVLTQNITLETFIDRDNIPSEPDRQYILFV